MGRHSGEWEHLRLRGHFGTRVLGHQDRLIGGAVVAAFSHEAWAASPGQLSHRLVANLVPGSEEGAVPFQERGEKGKAF